MARDSSWMDEALLKTQVLIKGDRSDGADKLTKIHKYQSKNLSDTTLVFLNMLLCLVMAMVLAGTNLLQFPIALLTSVGFLVVANIAFYIFRKRRNRLSLERSRKLDVENTKKS